MRPRGCWEHATVWTRSYPPVRHRKVVLATEAQPPGKKPPSLQAFPFLYLVSQRREAHPARPGKAGQAGSSDLQGGTWESRLVGAAGRLGPHPPGRHTGVENTTGPTHRARGLLGHCSKRMELLLHPQCERAGSAPVCTCPWGGARGPRRPGCTEAVGTHPRRPAASVRFCTF